MSTKAPIFMNEHGLFDGDGKPITQPTSKECKNCFGKGYNTEMVGDTSAYPDFKGDTPTHVIDGAHIAVHVCTYCQRGEDIKKYFTLKKKYHVYR